MVVVSIIMGWRAVNIPKETLEMLLFWIRPVELLRSPLCPTSVRY